MENALEFKPASTRYDTGRKFNGRIIWGQDFHCPVRKAVSPMALTMRIFSAAHPESG